MIDIEYLEYITKISGYLTEFDAYIQMIDTAFDRLKEEDKNE